jgi:hypothetical protein
MAEFTLKYSSILRAILTIRRSDLFPLLNETVEADIFQPHIVLIFLNRASLFRKQITFSFKLE